MDASEIENLEARRQAGLGAFPTIDEMERLMARIRHERNAHMAASFVGFVNTIKRLVSEVRRIAVACTAARLRLPSVYQ